MAKVRQSIIAQRQLPEHIRENYPVFVEFIKAYYDFLQQSQGQQLEQIRDIDTTLEEFIDRFKSELAKNFPIHLASDKAKVLKHLREFYLSRGSEDSFKFLFNVLFDKQAELFYPSTQILRVSDGRWHQDVSIFVKPTEESLLADPTVLIGKFIRIKNTQNKHIHVYIENIVKYSDKIYEIFIQRSAADEIGIGAEVDREDGSFQGVTLACPSRVKVYKAGRGFKIGDIFSLRSQLGRGCVIKVTKVDAEGGIKNIKVIRFGLDYKVKFYSYLSSKELGAWEYIHPLKLNTPYNPNDPAYNENSGGFIDSGWASKQTYFHYDPEVPVKPELDPSRASDRFFADPAYVGEVVEQFYADDSKKPIDEDLAIIEIELGGVAKYPGYYMTANGFISDEIYIQDGNYYQAFSYVVRVEEELRKYSDVVKALVHPAGMKIFSEYRIFNVLEVAAITRKITRLLQLPRPGHPDSVVTVTNRGISYNNYITEVLPPDYVVTMPSTVINAGLVTYPDPIPELEGPGSSGIIESRQGKAAKHMGKHLQEVLSRFPETRALATQKPLTDLVDSLDAQSKLFTKNVSDVLSEYIETVVRDYTKRHTEIIQQPDAQSKFVETLKTDIQLIVDSYSILTSKPVVDAITEITDSNVNWLEKNHVEVLQAIDVKALEYIKNNSDAVSTLSLQAKEYVKSLQESIINSDSYNLGIMQNMSEVIQNLEDIGKLIDKPITEIVLAIDALAKDMEKPFGDSVAPSDADSIETIKNFEDQFGMLDNYVFDVRKLVSDTQELLEQVGTVFTKAPFEDSIVGTPDVFLNNLNKIFDDTISFSEDVLLARGLLFYEDQYLDDALVNSNTKRIADTQAIVDEGLLRTLENTKSELININTMGRLRLAPYDQETYFAVYEDYQPAVSIQ